MAGGKLKKFKFKGYDPVSGEPRIFDNEGRAIPESPSGPPEGAEVELIAFGQNPTWVYIRGKWYLIG